MQQGRRCDCNGTGMQRCLCSHHPDEKNASVYDFQKSFGWNPQCEEIRPKIGLPLALQKDGTVSFHSTMCVCQPARPGSILGYGVACKIVNFVVLLQKKKKKKKCPDAVHDYFVSQNMWRPEDKKSETCAVYGNWNRIDCRMYLYLYW